MNVEAKVDITYYQSRLLRQDLYVDDKGVVRDKSNQYRSLIGGFGTGKTYSLCLRVIQKIQFRTMQNSRMIGIFTAPVHSHFVDVVIPQLNELLELYNYKYRYNKNDKTYFIHHGNKIHKLHLKSGEQAKRLGIVGINATDMFDDEFDVNPIDVQKLLWEQGEARLRDCKDPSRTRCSTPEGLYYSHWLDVRSAYETFEGVKLEQERETVSEYIRAETKDNIFLADAKGYVERLSQLYTPKQVQAYLNGYYVNLVGERVWEYFNEEKHVKKNLEKNGAIVSFWDFGWNDYTYCGFASVNASNGVINQIRILDEFRVRKTVPEDIYKLYKQKSDTWGVPLIDYCDPAGNQHHVDSHDGLSIIEQMEAMGLNYQWKRASIKSGIIIGNNMFHKNKILVNDTCKHFIAMLTNSSYEKLKNGGHSEKPEHGEHEAPEAAFRYLMDGECSIEYETIRKQR